MLMMMTMTTMSVSVTPSLEAVFGEHVAVEGGGWVVAPVWVHRVLSIATLVLLANFCAMTISNRGT